jgi:hypothetical protein
MYLLDREFFQPPHNFWISFGNGVTCPSGEIWLRESDTVLVPKSPILCADDVINLVFTRGSYGVFPMSATLNIA